MQPFWEPTALLFHRRADDLSADECVSLEYYIAFIDQMDGLPLDNAPRRWCAMAREADRSARQRGGVPEDDDSQVSPELKTWIRAQHRDELNAFQRARLEAIPAWAYAVS